ncbi:aluminum-activated malate transporter 8-like isoform X2 [Nicotiana tabacum]|uniref:Aluminum-activated malate transporter 8-like isoform X2 n=1 Tax=Nicotiana tabacum TaxID=4097 RepID=A0A1S3XVT7_TOBAC|nr:aluminum-activated malate transporter 8-like isoform X2 [Nicotiana tomentosiformis]XP_016444056.1 PREDICTED: aluminum-activated malate transporter 8-like isoform X2 [Nicotiana tabacum]
MEIDSTSKTDSKSKEQPGVFTRWWSQLKGFPRMLKDKSWNIAKDTKQIGKDDPRKIWHAAKVGLALTLVLLFYYSWPLYHSFEQSAIVACLTVMVAFEYTAGATMSKCINIAFATALGGTLGIGAKYLAELCGKEGEPIVLGFLVFILGALGTFTRFYPQMQRRYDYGCMLFVATFSLVTVSGDKYLDLDKQRISTIMVSVATVMIISLLICPVWAGEDLHNLVTTNLEKLASFLEEAEASGEGYKDNEKGFFEAFKSVLGSKATEESLANIAWWEPAHGSFRFNHPWKQYLKIGGIARECAGHLQSLSGHLKSKSQAPIEFNRRTEKACKRMITESSKALKELAFSIKIVTKLSTITTESHSYNARTAIADLKEALFTFKTFFLFEEADTIDVIGAMSVVSILIEVTKCVDKISEAVEELSIKARFNKEENNEKKKKKKKKNDSSSAKALEKPPPRPQLLIPVLEADNVNSGASVVIEIHDDTESAGKIGEEVNPVAAIKAEDVVCEIHAVGYEDRRKKGEYVPAGRKGHPEIEN